MAASLEESVGAAAGGATLEVAVTLVQTSEVAVKIDDGDKVEEVRAAFEAEVCAGDDSCSVEVVYRRLRARALDFSTAALTGAESDATAFTLRIVRELSGADSLAAPQLDKRMIEEALEAATGTGVEFGAAPAVTKLEAAVATTVEGADGAGRARALEAGLGVQLAAAAARATGVGSAASFDVEVRATMPPSAPPAPPPSPPPPVVLAAAAAAVAASAGVVVAAAAAAAAARAGVVAAVVVATAHRGRRAGPRRRGGRAAGRRDRRPRRRRARAPRVRGRRRVARDRRAAEAAGGVAQVHEGRSRATPLVRRSRPELRPRLAAAAQGCAAERMGGEVRLRREGESLFGLFLHPCLGRLASAVSAKNNTNA